MQATPTPITNTETKRPIRKLIAATAILLALTVTAALWFDVPPPDHSHFLPDPLPQVDDNDNGAALLRGLDIPFENLGADGLTHLFHMLHGARPWDQTVVSTILTDNRQPLDALRRALGRPAFVFADHRIGNPPTGLSKVQPFFTLKRLAARSAREYGEHHAAVDHLRDLARLGERTAEGGAFLFGFLVAQTGEHFTLSSATDLVPHLNDHQQLSKLAGALEHHHLTPDHLDDALRREFAAFVEYADEHGRFEHANAYHIAPSPLAMLFFKPNATLHLLLEIHENTAANAAAPHFAARSTSPTLAALTTGSSTVWQHADINHVGKLTARQNLETNRMIEEKLWHNRTHHTATLTLIALQRYQLDHASLPASLTDLVPAYLTTTPTDPYDGKPLRYDPHRRLLWSVGEDLTDAGGVPNPVDPTDLDWSEPTFPIPKPRNPTPNPQNR